MKYIQTFDENINESFFSKIKIAKESRWIKHIKEKIKDKTTEEKLDFVQKLIDKKQKLRGRLLLYSIIPLIASWLYLPNTISSWFLIVYFVIAYLLDDMKGQLGNLKHDLMNIKDNIEKEIKIKNNYENKKIQ